MTSRKERKRLEDTLRGLRPEPRRDFVSELASQLTTAPTAHGRGFGARVAVSGALTAVLLVALGAVGGIGYAASAAQQAAHVVKKAFVPSGKNTAIVVKGLSAGGDEYRPGFGFGDQNHNHTGPPGLTRGDESGSFTPPSQTIPVSGGIAHVVRTQFTIDEQAHLYISVVDPSGKQLLLTQSSKRGGSTVGSKLNGPQTKVIQYVVLVPRTIPLGLRVPANLLQNGQKYRIRIIAVDPTGNRSETFLPFTS